MKYVLNLDRETNRILSVSSMRKPPDDAVMVDVLPDGDATDYLYVDGEYVYSPLPAPEPIKPKPTQEERITALEEENKQLKEALDLLLSGATEEGEADG